MKSKLDNTKQTNLNKSYEKEKEMSNILFDLILQPSSSKHVGYLSLMSSAHKNYDNKMTINK